MKSFAFAACLLAFASARAQFNSSNINSYVQLSPTQLGGGSGNDCWGYTSPSGREYAIMGQNLQTTIVEITNPTAPVVVGSIPHLSSDWSGIKVYKNYAYVTTEATGSGLQVINLSNVDNGQVTLVRTISNPGRTHTLVVDEVSGFLYTCGSRSSSGTTMCFDLTNPANPVRVGASSLTPDYMHEAQVTTYTSGPFAGRQIFFGFSEGRGLHIYDVTNKNAPFRVSIGTYPSIGYCHQGWLSADKKYMYIDDEFDETNLTSPTRSIIFNVENINAPQYVGTFTTGLAAIDHNQYWDDGFIFQANYRSGLRIFDAKNPVAPVEVGYFDTYPNSDSANFSGAWSNYPFFPSGTIIISDINRGLFIINAKNALTRTVLGSTVMPAVGAFASGSLGSLTSTDGDRLTLRPAKNTRPGPSVSAIDLTFETYDDDPQAIDLDLQAACVGGTATQKISVLNVAAGDFQSVRTGTIGGTETTTSFTLPGAAKRFVNPTTRTVTVRVEWEAAPSGRAIPQIAVNRFAARVLR